MNSSETVMMNEVPAGVEVKKDFFSPAISAPLNWLKDETLGGILGRTAARHAAFSDVGLGYIGNVCEHAVIDSVFMDLLEPHIALLVGVRGSGKSYTQGVIVEELAGSNLQIGTVVIDRCGVFSGLRWPTASQEDRETLEMAGQEVKGLPNVKVFTPGRAHPGMHPFQLTVSDLTADDWIQFWNLNPDSPQGSLVRDLLLEICRGYRTVQGKVVAACVKYDLAEMESCLEECQKIQSRYGPATIRSLLQRLSSSQAMGLFARSGTSVKQLSVSGRVSVIDLADSSVDDICAAKVVGMIARMILQARQDSVRDGVEYIPVTWLVIDEAHLFVGESIQNGSAADLISYCKLGRRPGCALVLGTQQPSAMHKGVLSQADMVIAHQLVLESDIATLKRIIPASRPDEIFGRADLLRSLPSGTAVVADKLTQQRPVIVKIRPRKTRHDGGSCLPARLQIPAEASEDLPGESESKIAEWKKKKNPLHPVVEKAARQNVSGLTEERIPVMKKTWKQKAREHVPFFNSGIWKGVVAMLAIIAFLGGVHIASGWQKPQDGVGGIVDSFQHPLSDPRGINEEPLPQAVTPEASDKKITADMIDQLERQTEIVAPMVTEDLQKPVASVAETAPHGDYQRASRAFEKNQETLSRIYKK